MGITENIVEVYPCPHTHGVWVVDRGDGVTQTFRSVTEANRIATFWMRRGIDMSGMVWGVSEETA